MNTTATILDQLNNYDPENYDGVDNIWQDVILPLGIDDDATEAADPTDTGDVFILTNGDTYRHDAQGNTWRYEHP